MADINDRLGRLQRMQEFDRNGLPLRSAQPEPELLVTRPAGVDDRLGEVLDAVAAVVRNHPGLSVMVAVADGRAGRPVVRVTERDGGVETGVVVAGPGAAVAPAPAAQAEAAPVVAAYDAPTEPGYGAAAVRPEPAVGHGEVAEHAPGRPGSWTEPAARPDPAQPPVPGYPPVLDERADRRADGRHAAPHDDDEPAEPGAGWTGRSWHNSLWSSAGQSRFRPPEPDAPDHRRPDAELRLVPDEEPAPPAPPGGTIPLPEDTSEVVSRLAQLLRDNPTLASNWSREAPE